MVIAVTGATGYVGGRVARALAGLGVQQRLVVRDFARAPQLPGAAVAVAAFAERDAARAALDGVEVVLMVSAAEAPDRLDQHRAFVDAAAAAGVRHIVYTSFVGAAADSTFTLGRDHWATERHIRGTGMDFTFLQDSLYADFLPAMAGEDGVIRGPAGAGRAALVARDDVADVAVAVLRSPDRHVGATYQMTGPEALSLDEAAAIVTEVTGRAVRYHTETVEEAYLSRASYNAPDWQVDAWVSTYTAIANGDLEAVSDDVARVAGHPATSLAELLRRQLG